MRSVVVVFPASMCAMIPMLRTLARAASAAATVFPTCRLGVCRSLPAVVGEGLVGLGHLVRVLTPLHRGTEAVARVEQLVHEALDHGLLTPRAGVRGQPAQPQRGRPRRAYL